jgi:ParB-like chromosome segregation protein Spo0J
MTTRYSFHPACLAFPMLPEAELAALAEDIKLRGLQTPVVRHRGLILDGRNRLAACELAGVRPSFVEWDGRGSPTEWVIATNLVRRHLTASQRAAVALEILPLLEREAKQRQRLSRGRGQKVGKELPTFSARGKASEAAARIVKANRLYVQAVKGVAQRAPELVDAIRSGRLTVPDARRLAALPRPEREKVLQLAGVAAGEGLKRIIARVRAESRREQAAPYRTARGAGGHQYVLVGDVGMLWKKLGDKTVDLFLTDPPHQDVDAYGRLAELAAAKLKPGGLCLANCGHFRLPEVLAAMSRHLSYWWTFAVRFAAPNVAVHSRHVQNRWRPVAAFCKPPARPAPYWVADLVAGGGRDKEHHDWGQALSEATYLVSRLTEPGALVVDPFCGGGTVPAACKATGRLWLATEIDAVTASIARRRLAGMGVANS